MKEIYWIKVLGGIWGFSLTMAIVFGILAVISWIIMLVVRTEDNIQEEADLPYFAQIRKKLSCIFIVAVLLTIFIPSRRDMYLMWGVGGTIDYIRENKTAQGIPDKCIEALDIWMDTIIDKEEIRGNAKEKTYNSEE